MKRVLVLLLFVGGLAAADVSPVYARGGAVPLHVTLTDKTGGRAVAGFAATQPQIFLDYQGETLAKGDKIKAVWFIEDGGKGITPNVKVSESTLVADAPRGKGGFHLDKPAKGFPPGKWRVDVYVNDARIESIKFTVK